MYKRHQATARPAPRWTAQDRTGDPRWRSIRGCRQSTTITPNQFPRPECYTIKKAPHFSTVFQNKRTMDHGLLKAHLRNINIKIYSSTGVWQFSFTNLAWKLRSVIVIGIKSLYQQKLRCPAPSGTWKTMAPIIVQKDCPICGQHFGIAYFTSVYWPISG